MSNLPNKQIEVKPWEKAPQTGAIGRIYYYDSNGKIGDFQEFFDTKLYLKALEEVFYYRGSMGYKFETLSKDPEVEKAVKILIDNLL